MSAPVEKPKRPMTVRFLEMDKFLGTPAIISEGGSTEKDELDKLKEEDMKRKAKKLRELEMDTYLAQKEKELKSNQAQASSTAIAPVTMTPEMMTVLAGMPEDQRDKLMMTMMLMNSRGTDASTMAFLWPIMGGMAKANPAMTQADMIKMSEAMTNSLQMGWNMARQVQSGQPNQPSVLEIMNVMNNLLSSSVEKRLEMMVEKLQPQPGVFEQILSNTELFDKVKGFFTGGTQGQQMTPELMVELERIRGDNQINLNRMIMDDRWRMAEHNADIVTGRERIQAIKEIITGPLGAVISSMGAAGADVMRSHAGAPTSPPTKPANPPSGQPGQAAAQPQSGPPPFRPLPAVELIRCPVENCGQDFYVSSGAIQFECPSCHNVLVNTELAEAWQKEQEARISKQRAAAPARTQTPPAQAQAESPEKGKKPGEPNPDETTQETSASDAPPSGSGDGEGEGDEEPGVPYGTRPE